MTCPWLFLCPFCCSHPGLLDILSAGGTTELQSFCICSSLCLEHFFSKHLHSHGFTYFKLKCPLYATYLKSLFKITNHFSQYPNFFNLLLFFFSFFPPLCLSHTKLHVIWDYILHYLIFIMSIVNFQQLLFPC